MALGVVIGVVVWKVCSVRDLGKNLANVMKVVVLYVQSRGAAWHTQANEIAAIEEGEEQNGSRRQLEYPNGQSARYQDEPAVEDVEDSEDAVLASRVQPSQLRDDTEQWASERRD